MKLNIDRKVLAAALTLGKGCVPSSATLPILTQFLLTAKDDLLTISATDLDLHLQVQLPVCVDEPGACTVPARTFEELMRNLPEGEVAIDQTKPGALSIACGSSTYKFCTMEAGDFVPFPAPEKPVKVELPQAVLWKMFRQTSFCQSTDESRYVLCGSLIALNGKVAVVATDGRRLACQDATVETQLPQTSIIMPARAVSQLVRLLANDEPTDNPATPAMLELTDTSVVFAFRHDATQLQVRFASKLIEGAYPNYRQVIPGRTGAGIGIGRSDILSAVKRISLVAESATLDFNGHTLTISGKGEQGEATESLLIAKTAPIKIMFNARYLSDALEAVSEDQVFIHLTDDVSPGLLTVGDSPWECVIMPLRLNAPEEEAKPAGEGASSSPSSSSSNHPAPTPAGVPAPAQRSRKPAAKAA